jgi:hypothetical protein
MGASLTAAAVIVATFPIGNTSADEPVSFKDKTITIVVGFTPGGTPDVISRAAADGMAKRLTGKPTVIVRNAPGAAGHRPSNSVVAQTKPDGLTLVTGAGGHSIRSTIAFTRVYDPEKLIYVRARGTDHAAATRYVARLYDRLSPGCHGSLGQHSDLMWAAGLGTGFCVEWKWVIIALRSRLCACAADRYRPHLTGLSGRRPAPEICHSSKPAR